jgi:hypothetical protein
MVDSGDDPLEDARDRAARYGAWLEHLRRGDPAFAEASAVYPPDMSEWQSAVYLLTANNGGWGEFGASIMRERSIGPVVGELESPGRPWASSQQAVMQWAAHFWDVDRHAAKFPYVFEQFLFARWVTACHRRTGLCDRCSAARSRSRCSRLGSAPAAPVRLRARPAQTCSRQSASTAT